MHPIIIGAGIVLLMYGLSPTKTYSGNKEKKKTINVIYHYVDWCPYCIKTKPIWSDLKKKYKSKNIVFKEINGDFTKSPNVKTYPTIFLDNGKEVLQYSKNRSVDELSAWIDEHIS